MTTAVDLINTVMTKAQSLEDDELEKFFSTMCAMSVGVLRGMHDDEFIMDFLDAAKADPLIITPYRIN